MTENGYGTIPGNTKPGIVKEKKRKNRNFLLTLNHEENEDIEQSKKILLNKYDSLKTYLTNLKYQYFISSLETNKKGFYHIHIFIQFNTPHSLSVKKCMGAHIDVCRGSTTENINYVSKDGNILDTFGSPKINNHNATIKEIMNCNDVNQLLDFDLKYIKCIKEIKYNSLLINQPTLNTKKNVIVLSINETDNFLNSFEGFTYIDCDNKKFNFLTKKIILQITNRIDFQFILYNIFTQFNKIIHTRTNTWCNADITDIILLVDEIDSSCDEILDEDDESFVDYVKRIMKHLEIVNYFDSNSN